MNWGHKIAISFVLFAAFILYMVAVAFQQDIDLVAEDYYAQEISFQSKMQRKANLSDLGKRTKLSIGENQIVVEFPLTPTSGEIYFYHPSRTVFDRKYPVNLDKSNRQVIDRSELVLGSYRIKFTWTANGKEYFQQENIYLR